MSSIISHIHSSSLARTLLSMIRPFCTRTEKFERIANELLSLNKIERFDYAILLRHKMGLNSMFFKQEMEISLIGLQNAGKTSLVNVVATGGYGEDMIPTVSFLLLIPSSLYSC